MPPGKPHQHDHERESRRALNTPENAMKAVATCESSVAALAPGKIWRHRAPRGEFEIKACLLLNDQPVVVLHFSPEDGSLLPKGLHALTEGREEVVALVASRLKEVPRNLTVLAGAEFREPESCWAIPIAHERRIVGHLKVSADGSKILPDRKAAEDVDRIL